MTTGIALLAAAKSPPAVVGYNLLVSYAPDTEYVNAFVGSVGMVFGLTKNMTFNKVGMRCATGDTSIFVSLNQNDGGFALIASATITFPGGVIGQFYYATVPQFTLIGDSATTYVLSAAVGNDSQSWIGSSPCVIQNKFSLTSCYFNSLPPNLYTADQSYVGLDLAFA